MGDRFVARADQHVSIDERELSALFAAAQPHPLLAEIPTSLRPWLLPVQWDRERLWSIHRPPQQIPVAAFRWTYELPWWRANDRRWFQVTPRAYLQAPHDYPEHHRRTAEVDLSYPIHVMVRRGHYVPIDGIHRVVRADQLGHTAIPAIVLDLEDLESCLVTTVE